MNRFKSSIFTLLIFTLVCSSFVFSQELVIKQEKTGPIKTNCYLIYDLKSKDAALIDVGGPITALVETIKNENLNLKYILTTHVHIDHVEGIPEIKKQFPIALLCLTKADYEDFLHFQEWCKQNVDKSETAKFMLTTLEFKKWFEYDIPNFIKPDKFIEDRQTFALGDINIQAIYTPGHSRGSVSFLVNKSLFSGDTLFYGGNNVIDMLGSSQEDYDKTLKLLNEMIPDDTMVYPGHQKKTFDFGSGKKANWWVKQ